MAQPIAKQQGSPLYSIPPSIKDRPDALEFFQTLIAQISELNEEISRRLATTKKLQEELVSALSQNEELLKQNICLHNQNRRLGAFVKEHLGLRGPPAKVEKDTSPPQRIDDLLDELGRLENFARALQITERTSETRTG